MKTIIAVLVVLAVALAGFVGFVVVDSGQSSHDPSAYEGAKGAPVATISRGERVDFEDHLTPGIVTIFDFTADW